MRHPTFPGLTRELLATVKLVYKRPRAKTSSEGTLYFKLEDRAFSLSVFNLCDIYGFKKADKVKFPTLRDTNIFWDEIAVGDYLGSKAKAAQVRSLVLRYALKVMRNTIFARKDKCSEKRRAKPSFSRTQAHGKRWRREPPWWWFWRWYQP